MNKNNLHIDESTHKEVISTTERLKHALVSLFIGFLLIQIIGFWMFPGLGIGGLYLFSSAHSLVGFIANLTNVAIITFLAICLVLGWFQGKYFTSRLKGYINFWKFW